MKRMIGLIGAALLALVVTQGAAKEAEHSGHSMGHMHMAGTQKTVTGEVVDLGCYLGHGAKGEKHISCATKCIDQGMPMGLLTSNGTLYLITLDHDNADPYTGLKAMAGKHVSITGKVLSRSGMKAIEASEFKPMAAK